MKDDKPPYWLGLLCLFPLIGALVGIVLIILGIVKYKSLLLSLIGAVGVIFTVGIYSALFYNLMYGKMVGKGFEQISEKLLHDLVLNIEFYKLNNKHYPDSLEQIRAADPSVMIDDPLRMRNMDNRNRNTRFIYKKEGEKYILFSAGIDGIPNTPDDIYPDIRKLEETHADSSKQH